MNTEDIARVDTWLLQRGITPGTDTAIRRLARVWSMLQSAWPQDDAIEAAMLGVLRALACAAWSDPTIDVHIFVQGKEPGEPWRLAYAPVSALAATSGTSSDFPLAIDRVYRTVGAALVAALEASPCK